jgi:hypothetical protein
MRRVDLKYVNRCPTDRGPPNQHGAVPAKVSLPLVPPGIEQPTLAPSLGINAREIRSFMMIIREAGQSEVGENCPAAVLFGDNMIDFMGIGR